MQPLTEPDARLLWNMIPQNQKDHPPNVDVARSISLLSQIEAQGTPQGCAAMLPNGQAEAESVTFYHPPGSPIFKTRLHAYYSISFLNLNMDYGHRVKWYELTGREQYEWYEAFNASGNTYVRHEVNTRGLRGTNPACILNEGQLTEAMLRSPSLSERRPATHPVPVNVWQNTVATVSIVSCISRGWV